MKVFWWQVGLHIEPENDDERKALILLYDSLKLESPIRRTGVSAIPSSPSAQRLRESGVGNL
jgi:hypothetical protein